MYTVSESSPSQAMCPFLPGSDTAPAAAAPSSALPGRVSSGMAERMSTTSPEDPRPARTAVTERLGRLLPERRARLRLLLPTPVFTSEEAALGPRPAIQGGG